MFVRYDTAQQTKVRGIMRKGKPAPPPLQISLWKWGAIVNCAVTEIVKLNWWCTKVRGEP